MIRYLSGKDSVELRAVAFDHDIGLQIQPNNAYWNLVQHYPAWSADNGAFTTRACGFDLFGYITMITRPSLQKYLSTCLFITAPDALRVLADGTVIGDAAATLARFPLWAAILRELNFPVALVAQDGLEDMLGDVPWDALDVLFLGGSTEWKLGPGARRCVDEARSRGKRTHMGRVNSYKRLKIAQSWGIDSADGTFLKYGPDKNLPQLLAWVEKLRKDEQR